MSSISHARSKTFQAHGLKAAYIAGLIGVGLITVVINKEMAAHQAKERQRGIDNLRYDIHEQGFVAGVNACIKHVKGTNCQINIEEVLAEDHGPSQK